MKKRLATLAIVGAMAVSAAAPMTAFAHETNVYYVAGAENPGGPDSNYYVTVPADINFTDSNKTAEQALGLRALPGETLSDTLKVSVKVSSADAKLSSNPATEDLAYNVDFTGEGVDADGGKLDTTKHTDVNVGVLTADASDIQGIATLEQTASTGVAIGTVFTDVLTYTITETTP